MQSQLRFISKETSRVEPEAQGLSNYFHNGNCDLTGYHCESEGNCEVCEIREYCEELDVGEYELYDLAGGRLHARSY